MTTLSEPATAWLDEVLSRASWSASPHPAAGLSRAVWLVQANLGGQPTDLLLREDIGQGPFSGTAFTLQREALAVRALESTGIPVPQIYGISPSGRFVLMECLPGRAEVSAGEPNGDAALLDFVRVLAELHALDVADLTSTPLPIPATGREHALLDIAEHRRSYERLCAPQPTIDDAFAWAQENAPESVERSAVVHGDAGPGNFLHRDGRVTGVIDWEMTHLGDPMDDLAWLWFRTGLLRQEDNLASLYRAYERAAGAPIDLARVQYYCLIVILRCTVASAVRLAHCDDAPSRRSADRTIGWLRAALDDHHAGAIGATGQLPLVPTPATSQEGTA